jgi:hypothetical protein
LGAYTWTKRREILSLPFNTPRNTTLVGDNPYGLPKSPYFERPKPQGMLGRKLGIFNNAFSH